MKTPFSTTYRVGDSKLDVIESIGLAHGPQGALTTVSKAREWNRPILLGDCRHFVAHSPKGERITGTVYPSASTPHTGASL